MGTEGADHEHWAEARWIVARALSSLNWEIRTPEDAHTLARDMHALSKALHAAAQSWKQPPA